jgi:predicted ThiF/HesA family dinucleotide-utilizing enzyme
VIGAHAIVVGLGALGSPAALYLAAAGVERLGVVDPGVVEEDDPTRAILHFAPDVGLPKAENAAVKLRALNRAVHVEPYPAELTAANALAILADADVVLDCTGRRAVAEAPAPIVWASLAGGGSVGLVEPEGAERVVWRGEAEAGGHASALAGVVGSMQALEALRVLARRDEYPSPAAPAGAQSS